MLDTAETRGLAEELRTFELRVSDDAKLASGASRTGSYHDLVIALGLAALLDLASADVCHLS